MTTSSKVSTPIAVIGSLMTFVAVYFGKQYVIAGVLGLITLIAVVYILIGKYALYGKRGLRQYETMTYWKSDFGIKPWVESYEMQLQIANMLNAIAKHLGMQERIEPTEGWKAIYEWLRRINEENKFNELVKEDIQKKEILD